MEAVLQLTLSPKWASWDVFSCFRAKVQPCLQRGGAVQLKLLRHGDSMAYQTQSWKALSALGAVSGSTANVWGQPHQCQSSFLDLHPLPTISIERWWLLRQLAQLLTAVAAENILIPTYHPRGEDGVLHSLGWAWVCVHCFCHLPLQNSLPPSTPWLPNSHSELWQRSVPSWPSPTSGTLLPCSSWSPACSCSLRVIGKSGSFQTCDDSNCW